MSTREPRETVTEGGYLNLWERAAGGLGTWFESTLRHKTVNMGIVTFVVTRGHATSNMSAVESIGEEHTRQRGRITIPCLSRACLPLDTPFLVRWYAILTLLIPYRYDR